MKSQIFIKYLVFSVKLFMNIFAILWLNICFDFRHKAFMLISIRTFRGPSHHVRHSLPPDSRPKQLGCGFVPRPSVFVVSSVRYFAITALSQRNSGRVERRYRARADSRNLSPEPLGGAASAPCFTNREVATDCRFE